MESNEQAIKIITKDTEIENRLTVTRGERRGDYREKGEGFAGIIIKDTWTITRWGGLGWWGGVGGKGRKLYLNNKKKMIKK